MKKASKKLPIVLDNNLNGECWTFYKFSILKAYKHAHPWLASHIEFFINENSCGGYGDSSGEYYRMRYYDSILRFKKIAVCNIDEDHVIDCVVNEIQASNYIIIYLDFAELRENIETDLPLHEILLYGFDQEKCVFYCPMLINGKFVETTISYDFVKNAYRSALQMYMNDGWQLLSKRSYYFGITKIQVRNDYNYDNWVADYIDKIDHEIHGKKIIITEPYNKSSIQQICYTGNACFKAVCDSLDLIIGNKNNELLLARLIRTLKMMHDYRILFEFSIQCFMDCMNCSDDKSIQMIKKKMRLFAHNIETCYMLLCKSEKTGKVSILLKVKDLLQSQQKEEYKTYLEYRELLWPYYYQENGVPQPQEDD